ncbi:hypothetical protein [Streptomyces albus]|uniref:hypothetical protein n=1 Tax=Streptomyces albus TaxID=1888 RepID=UPI0006E1E554|nr:hypothetical protein [Streptomyces albus]
MDTAKLELAAKRHREAEEIYNAAAADLKTEALALLRDTDDPDAPATVARITGWNAEETDRLRSTAETDPDLPH